MAAYTMSFSGGFGPNTSRLLQDLQTCRLSSMVATSSDHIEGSSGMVSGIGKRRFKARDQRPHIAIVGAGLAGLRCASILLERDEFQVTILEGRDRLGGRVHQTKLLNGHLVDCGPNWIHGTADNPILDIAKKAKIPVSQDESSYFYNEDGTLLGKSDGKTYSTMMWDIVQDAFAHSNKYSPTISPDISLWDFFNEEVMKKIPDTEPDYGKKRELVLQMAEMWGAFVGNRVHTQSLKFFWLEECIEGENLFLAGTYREILQEIAKPALDKAHIKYSTVVTKVQTTDDDGNSVMVSTAGGETLKFDEVVFTAPLGWLKSHPQAFSPEVPSRFMKAVDSIGYGCLEKVYISFRKSFWLAPDSDGRTVTGFCQWLSPKYATATNPEKWNQEVVELGSLPNGTGHPTLLFYTYGDQSRYITGEVAKLKSSDKRNAFLLQFFEPYYSRLPHFDNTSPDCQPIACFSTDWLHDDLAGNGSYSNFQVGLEEGDKDIETMRQGLPERGLWFAGEHTAPYVALGTATGAYWSGESVGRRIKSAYGFQNGDPAAVVETSAGV